jgi:hypothetical protein
MRRHAETIWIEEIANSQWEDSMAQSSGGNGKNRLLYGVIIRDKIQKADVDTLRAYRTVANDLLNTSGDGDDGQLRASLADLDKAIAAKS